MRKTVFALVLATTSIAAILATPANAKERYHAVPRAQFNQLQVPAPAAVNPANDPTGVYHNGRLIGRDPDPRVRLQIEQYFGNGLLSE